METEQLRKEFANKVRRRYFKDHPKLCGRCVDNKGIRLHHKTPLIDGGSNEFSNLIPLCGLCHNEWHHAF